MSDRERLHRIIDSLPAEHVAALLTLLDDAAEPISDEEFARRLADAPEEAIDEETAARIEAALTEPGDDIPHAEVWNILTGR